MRDIRLESLKLKNFKGIKELALFPNGGPVSVFGDNATGKTSIFDSFTWLLFGKDSLGSAAFDIKTLDKTGTAEHGLEHEVEGVLDIRGKKTTLKKAFYEKWVKKRGSATKEFTGHTTDHFIDGVPVKLKEYNETVNSICDENLFRILTNPRYFNESLHWQERRKILLETCGDISDREVIDSSEDLKTLPDILGERKLEDHRKVVAARRSEINKELEKIPVRISENQNSIVETRDKITIESDLEAARKKRKIKTEELAQVENGGEIASLNKSLAEIDTRIINHENRLAENRLRTEEVRNKRRKKFKDAFEKADDELHARNREIKKLADETKEQKDLLSRLEKKMELLRANWHKTNDMPPPDLKIETACPTCGQDLPKEKIEVSRKALIENHNAAKAKELAGISAEGKQAGENYEKIKTEIERMEERLSILESDKLAVAKARAQAEKELHEYDSENHVLPPGEDETLIKLKSEKKALLEKLEGLRKGAEGSTQDIKKELSKLDTLIDELQAELLQMEQNRKITVRIEELKKQERDLAKEYEKLESELYLTEQFIRTKVSMLEDRINSRFRIVRWKLFDEQINGGLTETCIASVNGVPYGSMNSAAKIQAGCDIIRTLQEHFGIRICVWLDNRESVTAIPEMDCQTISLVVSAKDKALRIEGA